ncbi:MAG: glycosyltransferase family 4 protein [Rikenellaceae bacterium]
MKIAYIINSVYKAGGMERILCDKTDALVQRGVEVHIITAHQEGNSNFFKFNDKVLFHDLSVDNSHEKMVGYFKRRRSRLISRKDHLQKLDCLLNKVSVDVVISLATDEFWMLPKLTDKSKKIVEYHFSRNSVIDYISRRNKGVIKTLRVALASMRRYRFIKVLKGVERFVVLTKEDRDAWVELDNVIAIPNFSSMKLPDSVNPDYSCKRVIAVGRLQEEKGYDSLINAWSIVSKQYQDWHLSIYGDGSLRNTLQSQIDKLGLSSYVSLEGVTKDVSSEYMKSSIYVMTSKNEGMPLVLVEAMMHKLPIVSYAFKCGPRDMIDHNISGIIVDKVGDVDGLAHGLMTIMNSSSTRERMGQCGHKKSDEYKKDYIIDRWIELFSSL